MAPLQDKTLVNYERFLRCFEEVKLYDLVSNLPSKKLILTKERNFKLQKLLCNNYIVFYSVIRYDANDDLDKEALCKVFNMVEKRSKVHLESCAEMYIEKHSENNRCKMIKIGFNDFYNLMLLIE